MLMRRDTHVNYDERDNPKSCTQIQKNIRRLIRMQDVKSNHAAQ